MWTEKEQLLLERFDAAFPAPHDDNNCRIWTKQLAEQFAYTFPAAGWGTKSGGNGRPPSTDVICTRAPFVGYDVLVSQGTPEQSLAKYPEPLDLSGQTFIPVSPVNHLGAAPVPVPPPVGYPYPDEATTVAAYQARVKSTYAEAGRTFPDPNDMDAFRWFSRYGSSCREMPEPDAANKHIRELRDGLGLP